MKIRKGDYGYIRREKKKRLLVTLGLFVLPAIVFIVGLVLADGNKSNIFIIYQLFSDFMVTNNHRGNSFRQIIFL